MSDPRYRDPRLDPPPLQEDEIRSQRLNELESSNAMWGWVAGAVVYGQRQVRSPERIEFATPRPVRRGVALFYRSNAGSIGTR